MQAMGAKAVRDERRKRAFETTISAGVGAS